jgi:MFS family permease
MTEEEGKEGESNGAMEKKLAWVTLLNTAGYLSTMTARNELVLRLTKGDAARTASILTGSAAAGAAIEFLCNPLLGKMSDTHGRSVFLKVAVGVGLLPRLLVPILPDSLSVTIAERVIGQICYSAIQTISTASLSDCLDGSKLAMANTRLQAFAALGLILGPLLGGKLASRTGNPRHAYMFGSCAGLLQAYIISSVQETLTPKAMEAYKGKQDMVTRSKQHAANSDSAAVKTVWVRSVFGVDNPFSFLELAFSHGPGLQKLMLISGLQVIAVV